MAYHETFWVVTGAEAPVVALAVIVQMTDAFRTMEQDMAQPWAKNDRWGDGMLGVIDVGILNLGLMGWLLFPRYRASPLALTAYRPVSLRSRLWEGSDSCYSHPGAFLLCATGARRCVEPPGLAVTSRTLPSNFAAAVIRMRGHGPPRNGRRPGGRRRWPSRRGVAKSDQS